MPKISNKGIAAGYRSGLEVTVAKQLESAGVEYTYEAVKTPYIVPQSTHKYTCDFILTNSGIYVETKGRFMAADRKKHLLIKAQHPEIDLRFVFSRPKAPINKGSKTTYADWCEKNGFLYADKTIPEDWLL